MRYLPACLQRCLTFTGLLLALVSLQFAQAQPETGRPVGAEIRNVNYHFTDTIGVHILQLNGKLVPKKEMPIFDDKQSFILEIDAATIAMSTDDLTHVLNEYAFAGKDAPLKELDASDSRQAGEYQSGKRTGRASIWKWRNPNTFRECA